MTAGSMQPGPLMISGLLSYAAAGHRDREIVSRVVDAPLWRYTYWDLRRRSSQLANVLTSLGAAPGDRVSSPGMEHASSPRAPLCGARY
jgi:acyl-CoA synthetase (AMP-forming)/AMP-acid ligase II